MKDKKQAALLALFLGCIGAHHFYLKKYILGIIYILLAATTISIFLGIIDGLILLYAVSDEDFNARYNKHLLGKKVEHDIDSVPKSEINTLIDSSNKNEYKEQTKTKNFKYVPEQIIATALQVLESLYIIDTTKHFDTLKGRSEFLEQRLDLLKAASHNNRYLADIQIAIDKYKTMYYDKVITEQQIFVLTEPNNLDYEEFICISMFKSFKKFYEEQINQIESLKKPSAIKKRRENMMDLIDEIKNNLPSMAESYEKVYDGLGVIHDKIYAETYT